MSVAYSTPEELFAEQEAILERISRCQDILGSAILRARVALGIEPTTKAFFTSQVSWAKRGAIAPQPARRSQAVSAPAPIVSPPAPVAAPVVVAAPVPVAAPVIAAGPPPVVRDSPDVLAKFKAGTFFRTEVTWTARKLGAAPVAKPAKPSLAGQLGLVAETPALPVPPVVVARPAPPPVDYTAPAGAFFRTVPWQPGQSPAHATRTGANFLATATESALRAAQRLSSQP